MVKKIATRTFLKSVLFLQIALLVVSCGQKSRNELTPWGTPVEETDDTLSTEFTLTDIQTNGELIMLTLTGPETYYDYHGRGVGLQYMLCEKFAQKMGVSLRVEVCKDTSEMVRRLQSGDGDIIAFPLPSTFDSLRYCGYNSGDSLEYRWAVSAGNTALADTLDRWFRPEYIAEAKQQESFMLSTRSITRRVYSPMISRSGGIISHYDGLFQKYAPVARWDWRLLAAQCYQESTFDPRAHSWAGACGLMQIMPSTAAHLGLPLSQIYEPEPNISAAARYIAQLTAHFSDVPNGMERCYFVLAAYNGGSRHIRDAMALAQKNGRNKYRWADVSEFVLKLSTPQYYNDPVVKYGYMRGSETVGYVSRIRDRWAQYRGFARPGTTSVVTGTPHPAKRKNKYKI